MKRFLRALAQPSIFVPLALTAGMLTALFTLANLGAAIRIMASFRWSDLATFLLLMVGYEVASGV